MNETVLDVTSSTGVKSCYLSALMQNTGIIFVNEVTTSSLATISLNMQRLGVTNSVLCSYNYRDLHKAVRSNSVDRVLLSPPCSETGLSSRYTTLKVTQNQNDIWKSVQKQKQLLLMAIDMVDPHSKSGGYITYSTTSMMVEENENIIDYALRRRNIIIRPSGIKFGRPGFTKFRVKTLILQLKIQ